MIPQLPFESDGVQYCYSVIIKPVRWRLAYPRDDSYSWSFYVIAKIINASIFFGTQVEMTILLLISLQYSSTWSNKSFCSCLALSTFGSDASWHSSSAKLSICCITRLRGSGWMTFSFKFEEDEEEDGIFLIVFYIDSIIHTTRFSR